MNNLHNYNSPGVIYTCPMHPAVQQNTPGTCQKCGMKLVKTEMNHANMDHNAMVHAGHIMMPASQMSFWKKFKMSMTMTMGMEHTGLAGREMAALMEKDIKMNFFVSLLLTIPIILY